MIDHEAHRRGADQRRDLGDPRPAKSRIVRDSREHGILRWFRPVCRVGVLLLFVAPPTPLFGQFGEERAFNWFTGCAPIRITGQHHDYRLLEDAQVAEDFTFDLPADVKHIIRTKLGEHGLATEEVFAWGISGDLDEATILPRMKISVGTRLSGRREISMSFQKWLRDPISDKEHYATTWSVEVDNLPTRENELAIIENFIRFFLDTYLEVNAEACAERPSGDRPYGGRWRR